MLECLSMFVQNTRPFLDKRSMEVLLLPKVIIPAEESFQNCIHERKCYLQLRYQVTRNMKIVNYFELFIQETSHLILSVTIMTSWKQLAFHIIVVAAVIPCQDCSVLVESLDDSSLEDALLKQLEHSSIAVELDDGDVSETGSSDSSSRRHGVHVSSSLDSRDGLSRHGNCLSLPSEIHVTKDETDETGNVVRTCEGTIVVSKCEGTCQSELRLSVSSPTGLHKECYCCRESSMTFKMFSLPECFTPDGLKITHPSNKAVMKIKMKEPNGFTCHTCGLWREPSFAT